MTLENIAREARKLGSVLETYGNVLVPNIPGKPETTAMERLDWLMAQATEAGYSSEQCQEAIRKLGAGAVREGVQQG